MHFWVIPDVSASEDWSHIAFHVSGTAIKQSALPNRRPAKLHASVAASGTALLAKTSYVHVANAICISYPNSFVRKLRQMLEYS